MSLSLMLLPDELLTHILRKLPYQTCQILAKCCRRMLKIVVRERLYRRDDVHSMEIYYITSPNYGRYELLCYFMLENKREEWDKKYFLLDLKRPFAVQIGDEVKYHLEKVCFIEHLTVGHDQMFITDEFIISIFDSRINTKRLETLLFLDCVFVCSVSQFKRLVDCSCFKKIEFSRCTFNMETQCNDVQSLISLTDVFLDHWTSANGVWITDGKTEFTIDGVFNFIMHRATNTEKSFFCSVDGGGLNFAELEQKVREKAFLIGLQYDLKMNVGTAVHHADCRIGSIEFRVEVAQ